VEKDNQERNEGWARFQKPLGVGLGKKNQIKRKIKKKKLMPKGGHSNIPEKIKYPLALWERNLCELFSGKSRVAFLGTTQRSAEA